MRRRTLFKLAGVSALGCLPLLAKTESQEKVNQSQVLQKREFSVSLEHKILEQGKCNLWIPLPQSTSYQYLTSNIAWSGNYSNIYISNTQIPTLFAQFDAVKEPTLNINFNVTTIERTTDFKEVQKKFNPKAKIPDEVKPYLAATEHIQTDGIVAQTARNILKDAKSQKNDDLQKAKAIFEWVAINMQRDESILGCGIGDAKQILESKKLYGKCTDISSVFVALCRSVGIPAREIFGIRLGQSRFSNAMGSAKDKVANITGGQHCRAEFYVRGYGWIPCDPGDVAKVKLAEKLTNNDSKIINLRKYLFGNWEMCWLGYNTARDFILTPTPAQIPLNNFGYPYGEVDENVLDYYDAKEFSYSYRSIEKS
ncbi:transglutaminase domain-containing protein [Helicobacter sp. MIT 11-5569]|uniref:transglutaminase-like domain-containing protein n=1 Tax=Helicobacter sp. MIT 11-5569 TaxID=1548151 RepID=UPI00051F8EBF|nr:transglutaminase-like domain-containing protein [Helicobacter sp. MIT 11-5569]TLD82856.1 transglutaminase domain-containing protein [Helicobacter sp. MIT 11-5569]